MDKSLSEEFAEFVDRKLQILPHEIEKFVPELKFIDILRKLSSVTVVAKPQVSFQDSGMPYEDYIRRYYSSYIEDGYLPARLIDDEPLRRRISMEKSRGFFPADLRDIVLTEAEVLRDRRQAVAYLAGYEDPNNPEFKSFARSLFRQNRRKHPSPD